MTGPSWLWCVHDAGTDGGGAGRAASAAALSRAAKNSSPSMLRWGTARVITSAALIMVSVFCAFLINGDPNIKQFGLGMAAAVAVDATIVRCLLVPAILSLLGRAAWWLPSWLDRAMPHLSIEGEEFFAARDRAAAEAARPAPPPSVPAS